MGKFIITESDKQNILGMYGLINEQSSGLNLPNQIYSIISDIEKRFSYCKGGVVMGAYYSGNEKVSVFSKYVKDTIGFDVWNKLDGKTKSQIYSFAFQSDSGDGGYKYWWIKGLAQAIDSSFNRAGGTPSEAIKIIKNSKNLGGIYDNYLKVLKDQYNNITLSGGETDCNRKNVWGPRPDTVDRMLNGENHKTVLDDWEKLIQRPINDRDGVKISDNNLSTFLKSIQEKTTDMFITSNVFDIYFELDLSKNKYVLEIPPGNIKIQKMVLCLNTVDDNKNNLFPSKDSIRSKYPNNKIIKQGVFDNIDVNGNKNGKRNYCLIAIL
jgi:hypothetical protein